jgi:hypothetical protein
LEELLGLVVLARSQEGVQSLANFGQMVGRHARGAIEQWTRVKRVDVRTALDGGSQCTVAAISNAKHNEETMGPA